MFTINESKREKDAQKNRPTPAAARFEQSLFFDSGFYPLINKSPEPETINKPATIEKEDIELSYNTATFKL